MEFYSRSNYPETIPHEKCEMEVDIFELQIEKGTGKLELVKTGKTNVYEKIQASLESTLIYNILERYQNGDEEIIQKLQSMQGIFGDFTSTPKTLAEAQQILINASTKFEALPLEIRREFNNSTTEFLASVDNGNLEKVLKKYGKVEQQEQQKNEVEDLKNQIETLKRQYEGDRNINE